MFRVGITRDIIGVDGRPVFELDELGETPGIETTVVPDSAELDPQDVAKLDAIVLYKPRVSAATLAGSARLALVARLGVGVDNVDIGACTGTGVFVTTTPDGVQRPMAAGAMAFLLSLAHRLPEMDRHMRDGGFDQFGHEGLGLDGRTLGIIGLGNIGQELARLAERFGPRILATDPFVKSPPDGVELVPLEELLAASDFVVVAAPLLPETRHLLNAERLALLRPTAYLVNISRGPLVDQRALTTLLAEGRIAGAALDVFEQEPIDADDPLLALENVILSPHGLGMTSEIYRRSGHSVVRSILAVARGEVPALALNPQAAEHPGLRERLAANAAAVADPSAGL